MMKQKWVNIGSGNGLLPDGTKPLPKPLLNYHHVVLRGIQLSPISQKVLMDFIQSIILVLKLPFKTHYHNEGQWIKNMISIYISGLAPRKGVQIEVPSSL